MGRSGVSLLSTDFIGELSDDKGRGASLRAGVPFDAFSCKGGASPAWPFPVTDRRLRLALRFLSLLELRPTSDWPSL